MTSIDPSLLQWQPASNDGSVDPSQLHFTPVTQPAHTDPTQLKFTPVTHVDTTQLLHGAPKVGKQQGWLYGVGPARVMDDYNQTWKGFNQGGIRPQFKSFIDGLGESGFKLGIFDFNRGHHYAPNDPHLDGRAVDVDIVNGEAVDTKLTPKIGSFIETALAESPYARVGVPKEIYSQLPKALQARAFIDAPAHIHVELTSGGLAHAAAAQPVAHVDTQHYAQINTAGVQVPWKRAALDHWAQQQAQAEARIRGAMSILARVPIQGVLDALGAPQRGVGMAAYGVEHGHDVRQIIDDVWKGIADAGTAQHATDAVHAALSFSHSLIPGSFTREQLHTMIDQADIPAPLRPYIDAIAGTANDFAAQTISDPLTYVGGLGVIGKGVALGLRGVGEAGRVLAAFDDAARAAKAGQGAGGMVELMKYVPGVMLNVSAWTRKLAGQAATAWHDAFAIRPDLEDFAKSKVTPSRRQTGGFTPEGKQRRIAVENSELSVRNRESAADAEALRHPTKPNMALAARYLKMVHQYGSQADSDAAAAMMGLPKTQAQGWLAGLQGLSGARGVVRDMLAMQTPDERAEMLRRLQTARNRIREYRTADRTAEMVKQYPDSLRPGSSPQTAEDWRGVKPDPTRDAQRGDKLVRELLRANVMVFPYAHGIVNVGQLAYLGAPRQQAVRVVADAFRYMAGLATKGKLPGSMVPDEANLAKYGAAATYVHEHEAPGFWAHLGDSLGGKLVKNHIIQMQTQLQGMEASWRAALWDALERNPDTAKLDPLIRGAMVAQHAGDPRNVAAFVRWFEKMGGPFVAYRLGIVPRAVVEAIGANPQRVLAAVRLPLDLQANRTEQAQHANTFMLNDPVENFARMASPALLNYMLSPSTIGLWGLLMQTSQQSYEGQPWEESLLNTLGELNPAGGVARSLLQWLPPHTQSSMFNPMPGQKMSLVDHLTGALMAPLASFYFAKPENSKYAAQQMRRIEHNVQKFWTDFWDAVEMKGS